MSIEISDHIKALLPWRLSAIVFTPEKKNRAKKKKMETWLGEERECAMDGGMSVCERRKVTFVLVDGVGVIIYGQHSVCV